jgi:hypothetical protein
LEPDGTELDPEHQRVVGDRARVRGPLPKGLTICLAGAADI